MRPPWALGWLCWLAVGLAAAQGHSPGLEADIVLKERPARRLDWPTADLVQVEDTAVQLAQKYADATADVPSASTSEPTGEPTLEPTGEPTAEPTGEPTSEPTREQTALKLPASQSPCHRLYRRCQELHLGTACCHRIFPITVEWDDNPWTYAKDSIEAEKSIEYKEPLLKRCSDTFLECLEPALDNPMGSQAQKIFHCSGVAGTGGDEADQEACRREIERVAFPEAQPEPSGDMKI